MPSLSPYLSSTPGANASSENCTLPTRPPLSPPSLHPEYPRFPFRFFLAWTGSPTQISTTGQHSRLLVLDSAGLRLRPQQTLSCVRLPRSLHLPPSHRPFSTAGRRTENGSWVLSPCSITGIWRGNLRGFHTRVGRTTAPCSVRVGSGFPVPPIRRQPTSEVDQKFRLDFARTTSHEKSLRHIDFRKSATLARVKPSDDGAPSPQHHDNHGPPPATIEPQGLHDLV